MTGTTGATVAVTLPTDTSIQLTRLFTAPAHHLYRALTEPDLLRRWWSGGTGEVRVAEVDPKVGGRWRVVVVGDGYEVGLCGVHFEVVPAVRIIRTEVDENAPDAEAEAALCTYTFSGTGDRSSVSLVTALRTQEHRDALLDSGMDEGVAVAWDLWEQVAVALR